MRKLIIALIIAIVGSFSVFTQETEENVRVWNTGQYANDPKQYQSSENRFLYSDRQLSRKYLFDTLSELMIETGIYKYDIIANISEYSEPNMITVEESEFYYREIITVSKFVDGVIYEVTFSDSENKLTSIVFSLQIFLYDDGIYDASKLFSTGYDYNTGEKLTKLQDLDKFDDAITHYFVLYLNDVEQRYTSNSSSVLYHRYYKHAYHTSQ